MVSLQRNKASGFFFNREFYFDFRLRFRKRLERLTKVNTALPMESCVSGDDQRVLDVEFESKHAHAPSDATRAFLSAMVSPPVVSRLASNEASIET